MSRAFNQSTGDSGIVFVIDSVTGKLLLTFDEDREMSLASDNFVNTISIPALGRTISAVVEASGMAKYTADGEKLTASDFDALVTSQSESGPVAIDLSGNTAVIFLPLNNLFGYRAASRRRNPAKFHPPTERIFLYRRDLILRN